MADKVPGWNLFSKEQKIDYYRQQRFEQYGLLPDLSLTNQHPSAHQSHQSRENVAPSSSVQQLANRAQQGQAGESAHHHPRGNPKIRAPVDVSDEEQQPPEKTWIRGVPSQDALSSFSGRRTSWMGTKVPKSLRESQPLSFPKTDTPSDIFVAVGGSERAVDDKICPLPPWYWNKATSVRWDRSLEIRLKRIRSMMDEYPPTENQSSQDLDIHFDNVRAELHDLEHLEVEEVALKKSKLLERQYGLPRLWLPAADATFRYPFDIRLDAQALYRRWCRHDFNPDLMRGIDDGVKTGKGGKSRYVARIDPTYGYRCSPNFIGAGDLVNGQWWPTQLTALRDGAHGATVAGIHGEAKAGAYSVLLSRNLYENIDRGDTIWYCGTKADGFATEMTDDTKLLMVSIKKKGPVRVLRTHSLPLDNPYRPARGVRYDGLYQVVRFEVLDPKTLHHRFELVRLPDQDPIRYQGLASRPTLQEINAYDSHRRLARSA